MSTITKPEAAPLFSEPQMDEVPSYRTISKAAIFSLSLGVLSVAGLLFPGFLVLAFVGLVLGIVATVKIKRYPDELSGFPAAVLGVVLCGLLFVGGLAKHINEYVTELPEGYTSENRHSFSELQPSKNRPELPISPLAIELSGQKIFLKGYVHPDFSGGPVKNFILVPDMNTCCFGGQPKTTDMIEVTLRDPLRITYNQRLRKVAGVFQLNASPQRVPGMQNGVFYHLDAEYMK